MYSYCKGCEVCVTTGVKIIFGRGTQLIVQSRKFDFESIFPFSWIAFGTQFWELNVYLKVYRSPVLSVTLCPVTNDTVWLMVQIRSILEVQPDQQLKKVEIQLFIEQSLLWMTIDSAFTLEMYYWV